MRDLKINSNLDLLTKFNNSNKSTEFNICFTEKQIYRKSLILIKLRFRKFCDQLYLIYVPLLKWSFIETKKEIKMRKVHCTKNEVFH